MDSILIRGGVRLSGRVVISGAKNAALPAIAAALLTADEVVLTGVPALDDVGTMCELLDNLGVCVNMTPGRVRLRAPRATARPAPYDLVRRMRASFLVAGPLLARFGVARMPMPGGCAIGSRPINLHLKAFAAMGADLTIGNGCIEAVAPAAGLRGARVYLDYPSVGATENALMAAVLADGVTVIENAAQEPEVVDLANLLSAMGAKVRGAGTGVVKIEGVDELRGASHTIVPDRIEAGTYMAAAVITRGDVLIDNVVPEHLAATISKLREAGAVVETQGSSLRVSSSGEVRPLDIKTMPYPGFPTDLQAQFMALLSIASGTSVITETVFENRFMHVDELARMGARIKIDGRSAVVEGVETLSGAPVRATDLRAGAALVVAALASRGETEIFGVGHIDRGYEAIEHKLRMLGAVIERRTDVRESLAAGAGAL
ncbi:MAG: UDP-N-acetylglucosamine 1-carboxyvinyltransferase [Firmicutes bacterium]|nr:UDP-N-acetylglucosamine 1-carboxyvinyltransferase [Bacillota bacterium]MDH7494363.1 UDP-N-acetylglucosamine 1-carboxyvinyltransferase [Bacillota bacterium]